MERVLQYNFGYLPPRATGTSDLPLSTLLANKRTALGGAGAGAGGDQIKLSKRHRAGGAADLRADAQAALERRCVNYVRVLSAEMVQAANSGHPGAAMGLLVQPRQGFASIEPGIVQCRVFVCLNQRTAIGVPLQGCFLGSCRLCPLSCAPCGLRCWRR